MTPYLSRAIVAGMFTLVSGLVQAGYAFQSIVDPLNPGFTQALGINNSGSIVGYSNATIFNGFQLAPPYASANFVRQNVPAADGGTQVVGISGSGTTVGFSITAGVNNGFAHTSGTFTAVDEAGTAFNQLLGINSAGTNAAGYSSTDPAGLVNQHAMTVSGGPSFVTPVFTNINAMLPANFNSQATGLNDAGTVVGFYQYDAGGDFAAFSDIAGLVTPFQFPSSLSTQALGINNLGEIVGDYIDGGGAMHGFLDNAGAFMTLDFPGSLATTANGINALGQIVGFYTDANANTVGFLARQSVPEPATMSLVAIGFAGIAYVRRRRSVLG
jgi:hypothetical protein